MKSAYFGLLERENKCLACQGSGKDRECGDECDACSGTGKSEQPAQSANPEAV